MNEAVKDGSLPHSAMKALDAALGRNDETLLRISTELFENPELSGAESLASTLLSEVLQERGFDVDIAIPDLPTAFVAKFSIGKGGGPRIGFFCEYDALPELGHACGHNLIAAASLVAGISVADSLVAESGEVWVIGSPAEETFGGKIGLLRSGQLDGLDAAMMFHPGQKTRVCSLRSVGTEPLEVTFYKEKIPGSGRCIPASPVLAITALFQSIPSVASLFQERVLFPGVIIEGGSRPNVIPKKTVARFSLRAGSRKVLRQLMSEFQRCVRASAQISGCSYSIRQHEPGYKPIIVNQTIGHICEEYLIQENMPPCAEPPESPGAYDIGNVSRILPVIHPIISKGFENVSPHTQEFAEVAGSEVGLDCARLAAKILARTALRLLLCPEELEASKRELDRQGDRGRTQSPFS
ncbi:amidohydrolase [bacterium]|nr:amidohydrolase [bacterium]